MWGDNEGEIKFHPDEAITGAIRTVFARFAEMGSARQVWLWFRSQGVSFPFRKDGTNNSNDISWDQPTYWRIRDVLTNPVYAGAYAFGRTQHQRYVDTTGRIRKRVRNLPKAEWRVLIQEHHESFIDWQTYERNQIRLCRNTRPRLDQAGGAVREGAALLQGLAICGHCGRKLRVNYQGRNSTPSYYCPGSNVVESRQLWCLRMAGSQIDDAVAKIFLREMNPAGIEAALLAEATIESEHNAAVAQLRLEVERTRYEAQRAERRYRAVEPENRLVARGLETHWERCLQAVALAERKLSSAEEMHPRLLTAEDREKLHALGADISKVWTAQTTTHRDRKELLLAALEEVTITASSQSTCVHLTLRWRGGELTETDIELKHQSASSIRTDEDTVELIRRLARYYPDTVIAGILNRQGRLTATGEPFTGNRLNAVRRYWNIPRFDSKSPAEIGELLTVDQAAVVLGVASSTVHRWLAEGFIPGEQITPGAPWKIKMTDELRARFVEEEIAGYLPMIDATKLLGVTRQTIMQRIKRGELKTVHIIRGKRKGLRIKVAGETQLSEGQLSIFTEAE